MKFSMVRNISNVKISMSAETDCSQLNAGVRRDELYPNKKKSTTKKNNKTKNTKYLRL
jgi:hypothetical protein